MSKTPTPYVIVVAFDMSEQAERALEQAIELAQNHEQANLHVLGVLDNRRSFGNLSGSKYDYEEAENTREILREVADKKLLEAESNGLNLFVHARIGGPAEEILTLAREAQADILVVGTHGRSGVGRWLLGSVAEKVVRFAPCPVLVARPHTEHREADAEFQPEPPCPACVAKREETGGAVWWCEQHDHPHARPHVFSYRSGIAQKRPDYAPIL